MKKVLPLLCLLVASGAAFGQVLYTSGTYSENFDGMASGTTTPTGWFVGSGVAATVAASSVNSTAVTFTSGGATASGSYNFLTANPSWYTGNVLSAISSTPGTTTKAIQLDLTNNSGQALTQFTLSYTGVEWRQNTGTQYLQFSYSLNGTTWTSVSALDFSNIVTGASAQVVPARTQNLSSTVTLTSNWTSGSNLYLRWYLSNGSAASGAYGLDNVAFTAVPEPSTWALLSLGGFGLLIHRLRRSSKLPSF